MAKITPSQKITPFLWFDYQAEEAAKFYVSVFKRSKLGRITRYGKGSPGPEGSVMTVSFKMEGQEFIALNGGPIYKFSPAISFFVNCGTQAEVDDYWKKLSKGGKIHGCAWLDDKFGVTWQIVPTILGELLHDHDPAKARRVMEAMLQMTKMDIKRLKQAYRG